MIAEEKYGRWVRSVALLFCEMGIFMSNIHKKHIMEGLNDLRFQSQKSVELLVQIQNWFHGKNLCINLQICSLKTSKTIEITVLQGLLWFVKGR